MLKAKGGRRSNGHTCKKEEEAGGTFTPCFLFSGIPPTKCPDLPCNPASQHPAFNLDDLRESYRHPIGLFSESMTSI
jgi:hypothetical protein